MVLEPIQGLFSNSTNNNNSNSIRPLSIQIPSPNTFLSQQIIIDSSSSISNEEPYQNGSIIDSEYNLVSPREGSLLEIDEVLNDDNFNFNSSSRDRIEELHGLLGGYVDRDYMPSTTRGGGGGGGGRNQRTTTELDSDEDRISTPVTLTGNFDLVRDSNSCTTFSISDEDSSERDEGIQQDSSNGSSRRGFRHLDGLGLDTSSSSNDFDSLKNLPKSWTTTELVQETTDVGHSSTILNHPYNSFTQIPSEISLPPQTSVEDDQPETSNIITPSASLPVDEQIPDTVVVESNRNSFATNNSDRMDTVTPQTSSARGARGFFSSFLNRNSNSPLLSSESGRSSPISRTSSPFQNSLSNFNQRERRHSRSSSLPTTSPDLSSDSTNTFTRPSQLSSIITPPSPQSSSPLARSSSVNGQTRNVSQPFGSTYSYSSLNRHSRLPLPKFNAFDGPKASTSVLDSNAVDIPTLEEIGLSNFALTKSISTGSIPLCGAILDSYILIGTTSGLDFLPIPLPGSLPMQSHGKKRRDTRKPISLIKRTRFKQLSVLSERSNILVAIAGRNDHIRVYALDTLRAMIEKKMGELDMRDGGYHIIPDPKLPDRDIPPSISAITDPKGKRREEIPLINTSPILAGAFTSQPDHLLHSTPLSSSTLVPPILYRPISPIPLPTAQSHRSYPRSIVTAVATTSKPINDDTESDLRSNVPRRSVRYEVTNEQNRSNVELETNIDEGNQSEVESARPSSEDWNAREEISSTSSLLEPRINGQELTRSYRNMNLASILLEGPEESATLSANEEEDSSNLAKEETVRTSRIDELRSAPLSDCTNLSQIISTCSNTRSISAIYRQVPREATTRVPTARDEFLDFLNNGPLPPFPTSPVASENEEYRSVTTNRKENSTGRLSTVLSTVPSLSRHSPISPYSVPPLSHSIPTINSVSSPSFNTRKATSTGMERESSSTLSTTSDRLEPRDPSSLRLRQASRPSFLDLANVIRETGPSDSNEETQSMVSENPLPDIPQVPSNNSLASKRASKRWTINGLNSLLNRTVGGESNLISNNQTLSISRSNSPEPTFQNSLYQHQRISMSAPEMDRQISLPLPPIASIQPLASTPLPPHDFKQRSEYAGGLDDSDEIHPSLPASSQIPQESTAPSASSSSLEYVKLARTKGARMYRAIETKKRTYLAVLCGDEGERVELFTGSRGISLSLNRTFVLPESPRTIEFQIQQDDLVDIYLVYAASIFGLEPYTVRVREVGVGRGERRIRRDRERRMQEVASESTVEPGEEVPIEESISPILGRHPADDESSLRPVTPEPDTSVAEGMDLRSPSPAPRLFDEGLTPSPSVIPVENPFDGELATRNQHSLEQEESNSELPPPPVPPKTKVSLPYSTFQQLPFIPPVPSCILSSAWVIPPLYSDVTASNSSSTSSTSLFDSNLNPEITVTPSAGVLNSPYSPPPSFDSHNFTLLSPISLLEGTAQQKNTPPGLFFVSKSKHVSGIVDANGRSIIRKPIVWNKSTEPEVDDEAYRNIEVLVVNSASAIPRTVIVAIGLGEVKAIAIGDSAEVPFGEAVSVSSFRETREMREIQFLGTHHTSNQLFYSDVVNGKWIVYCLIAKQ